MIDYGGELMRSDGEVYFFSRGHHGWGYHVVGEEELDRALRNDLKASIDEWLDREHLRGRPLAQWEELRFAALTGYDRAVANISPREWWATVRGTFHGDQKRLNAYAKEHERQGIIKDSRAAWEDVDRAASMNALADDGDVLSLGMTQLAYRRSQIEAFRTRYVFKLNAAFEALYFSLVVFFFGYGYPGILRRIRRWTHRIWIEAAARSGVIYAALILPYALGYSPWWGSTAHNQGTIIYNTILHVILFPVIMIWESVLPHDVFVALGRIGNPLDYVFYPVLNIFHTGTGTWSGTLFNNGRGMIAVMGLLTYAVFGMLVRYRCGASSREALNQRSR